MYRKIAYLLIPLLFILLSLSCGGREEYGSLTLKLVLEKPSASTPRLAISTCPEISTIHISILKPSTINNQLSTELVREENFPKEAKEGIVDRIPAGTNYTVLAEAINDSEVAIFSGSASGISVFPGEITDAGTIVMTRVNPLTPPNYWGWVPCKSYWK